MLLTLSFTKEIECLIKDGENGILSPVFLLLLALLQLQSSMKALMFTKLPILRHEWFQQQALTGD